MKKQETKEEMEERDAADFWLNASEPSLDSIWSGPEDDVYAELLEASMSTTGKTDVHKRGDS